MAGGIRGNPFNRGEPVNRTKGLFWLFRFPMALLLLILLCGLSLLFDVTFASVDRSREMADS